MLPKIIHQTWKAAQLPPDLRAYQRTWRDHHPGWEYRLWTDVDNRQFIEEHYPWFLPIYDHYPLEIMRADAVRYFILFHFGGLYADLDYECLRPFEPLLAGRTLLLGLEPASHLQQVVVRARGFQRLISNVLMASVPGHPFWPHVFRKLVEFRDALGPLDAAGPFLLTRAYESYAQQETISLARPEQLFPLDFAASRDEGREQNVQQVRGQAGVYGIHYWRGSWVRSAPPPTLRMRLERMALRWRDLVWSGQRKFWEAGNGFFRKRQETAKAWSKLAVDYLGFRRPTFKTFSSSIWLRHTPEQPPLPHRPTDPAGRYSMAAAPRQTLPHYPTVLILCPVKDAVPYLPQLWTNLRTLSYPHHKLSLAFLESDSQDGTFEFIQEHLPSLRADFTRVEVFKVDYGFETPKPRWLPTAQLRRRSILARSRNQLLARALQDEDWVLWIDVDVCSWPNDVIEQLLATDKDIVTPNCVTSEGKSFDQNAWKLKPEVDNLEMSSWISLDIWLPPSGEHKYYLQDLRHYDLVEIDSVGGTMLLVRADIHREGLIFPTFPYKYLIETEGLAAMARDMGYACWGMPNLEIIHS